MRYGQKLALRAVELSRKIRDQLRRKYFRSDADIEDAQQSTYLKLLEYGKTEREVIRNIDGFVSRAVANQVVQEIREEAALNLLPWERRAEEVVDPRGTPEDVVNAMQGARLVVKAAKALPKNLRRVMWLSKREGMTVRQIAERDGVTEARVKADIEMAVYRMTRTVRRRTG